MGANGSLNGRIMRLEEVLTPRSSWDAFWDETKRRWVIALDDICRIVPVDMCDEVALHLKEYIRPDPNWWLNHGGGLWRWQKSLVWCHSQIPAGMIEAAVRETLRRFMDHRKFDMTCCCYGCGLCAVLDYRDGDMHFLSPCPHCNGTDLVGAVYDYERPRPPWDDDWPARFRPKADEI